MIERASENVTVLTRGGHAVVFHMRIYAVAAYANLYAHIRMKPHRKIRTVYAEMRISAYAEKNANMHSC